jgi:hypothetical protein
MLNWLKLSQHQHSGRLRPHEHTSYLPLGILLVIIGFALTAYTAYAATPYDGPEAGSIGMSGIMPGEPPTIAATIKLPANQQRFGTSPITVSGTCPKNTLVEIFKNDIFAGSTTCNNAETYSLDVDLMINKNILIARVYDSINQAGPDSNSVIVYYDALPPQAGPLTSLDFGGAQLLLNTDAVFRGTFPGQVMYVPIDILGGTPPYAINIQWGDSTNKVIPRSDNAGFKASHIYTKAGTYQISIQATDLTVAAIVNGQPGAIGQSGTSANTSSNTSMMNQLLVLWPTYTGATAVVASFFLGEQREKRLLRKQGLLLAS